LFAATDLKKVKVVRYTIITNKYYVDVAMNFFHKDVLKKLTAEHMKLLALTPFLHLFAFPKNSQANNAILHNILLMWDGSENYFNFKGAKLEFTAEKVSLIMCLPSNGNPVVYKRKMITGFSLRARHFRFNQDISRHQLEQAILKAIDDKVVADDVVELLVMYIFTTILFPQAGGTVPVHIFHYVENIEKLWFFSWGEAVFQMLMDNIPFCSIWCRNMENGEECDGDGSSEDEDPLLKLLEKKVSRKKKGEIESKKGLSERKKGPA
jgi:hypothetical protein